MVHTPVLLAEVLEYLAPQPDQVFVDMTLGLGGHTKAILQKTAPRGRVFAFEQDARNLVAAKENLKEFSGRVEIAAMNFVSFPTFLQKHGTKAVDGILFDLGISSAHLDDPERGFSFRHDGPLDMRMKVSDDVPTAADILNSSSETELCQILREYGEVPRAYLLAEKIVARRKQHLFVSTADLAQFVEENTPKGKRAGGGHPAALVFQALRIAVNDELNVLRKTLSQTIEFLRPGARLAVISFHSLEDRIVKEFFRQYSARHKRQKYPSQNMKQNEQYPLKLITKKAILPTRKEVTQNPRARSARMRVAEKIL